MFPNRFDRRELKLTAMARRLHQTLADYVVIAISPALIMALVGSLMFFLLRIFYQGQFQERLHFVMVCFVFASVLIARIAIEEGFERAAPFGAALAILVGLAANKFMEYQGTWIDDYAWIINFTVIGIVWWCVHQLTWDCTVIDDSEDSSGEGLMQIVGLEKPADERNRVADEERLAGTTTRQVPAGFWQRYVERQRRPHAPGVWVVYFSLAALPIFGLGQWLIPASDTAGRRYVFLLLCVYVASGLGLLLTTSFLGLRRYLRQRRIEMPTMMANLWLGTGAAIIVALIAVAMLLPRPSAEYAISELPFTVTSPERESSQFAPSKRDGTEDEKTGPAAEQEAADSESMDHPPEGSGNQPGGQSSGDNSGQGESESSQSNGEGDQQGQGDQKGQGEAGGQSGSQSSQQGQASQQSNASQSSGQQQSSESGGSESKPAGQQGDQSNASESGKSDESSDKPAESDFVRNLKKYRETQRELAAPYEDKSKGQQQQDSQDQEDSAGEDSAADSFQTPEIEPPLGLLATIVKYVFYAVFILAVLYFLWRYWPEVLRAVQSFLAELRAWWQSLWGGKRDYGVADDVVLEIRTPPQPFSRFADPFATGMANRQTPEELVRYSFEAFEAWAREHGCERSAEQTPHEHAREVARLNAYIAADARNLAELYTRAAFARGQLPRESHDQMRKLWQQMTRRERVAT